MKTAPTNFTTLETLPTETKKDRATAAGWIRYATVVTLLMLAYASFAFLPNSPITAEMQVGVGFLAFWLIGALATITLVALSGRSDT